MTLASRLRNRQIERLQGTIRLYRRQTPVMTLVMIRLRQRQIRKTRRRIQTMPSRMICSQSFSVSGLTRKKSQRLRSLNLKPKPNQKKNRRKNRPLLWTVLLRVKNSRKQKLRQTSRSRARTPEKSRFRPVSKRQSRNRQILEFLPRKNSRLSTRVLLIFPNLLTQKPKNV